MERTALGIDPTHTVDAVLVNSPLKDYDLAPRHNDYTLPVLGLGYLATFARSRGFNIGVLDVEAGGLGLSEAARIVNDLEPRWVGLNLLAPTYPHSVTLLRRLDPRVRVMLGGHQAKAMPHEILRDDRIPRVDALVVGEADTRVAELLADPGARERLPGVFWRGGHGAATCGKPESGSWLAPDLDSLPLVDRDFFADDPFVAEDGRLESAVVGSRGCPYDCSFCGAARSANPDVRWRMREPETLLEELSHLEHEHGVEAVRFVDDLFLARPRYMERALAAFREAGIGDRLVWDATGRINVLDKVPGEMLELMRESGCREVALGIESGSERMLKRIDKRITPAMTERVVRRLGEQGIRVKGYFILGFPTETAAELQATEGLVRSLWQTADEVDGLFRASVFEFRPYPGTPEWGRLMASGRYTADELLDYQHVDLTNAGADEAMRDRDEFNFSSNIQFGEVPVARVRETLARIVAEQDSRRRAAATN